MEAAAVTTGTDDPMHQARTALRKAEESANSRNFLLTNQYCLEVLDASKSQQFNTLGSRVTCGATEEIVDILLECGQICNKIMRFDTAMKCFNHCAYLIVTLDITAQLALKLCKALSSMVHVNLYSSRPIDALNMLTRYSGYLIDFDMQEPQDEIKACLGNLYFDVGQSLSEMLHDPKSIRRKCLERGRQYLIPLKEPYHVQRYAHLLTVLGESCSVENEIENRFDYLSEAVELWKRLDYPQEASRVILDAMRSYLLTEIRYKWELEDFAELYLEDMLQLHARFHNCGLNMDVADALVCVGHQACDNEFYRKALRYFNVALNLHQNHSPSSPETIREVLDVIGSTYYNLENYSECVKVCHKRLAIIEADSEEADCCFSLALCYSQLQDFQNMLQYYERVYQLCEHLGCLEVQFLKLTIGNVYFIKAVMLEKENEAVASQSYFAETEQAFTRALRFAWKASPFIDYGYFLLYKGHFESAVGVLQQAYLNAVMVRDVIKIDKTMSVILPEYLQYELQHQKHLSIFTPVLVLYFKCLAQLKIGRILDAKDTCKQLEQEIRATNFVKEQFAVVQTFGNCYAKCCGPNQMKATSLCLLAYLCRDLGNIDQAKQNFQLALGSVPGYSTAELNLLILQSSQMTME